MSHDDGERDQPQADVSANGGAVAAWLRALAAQAQRDPTLAAQVLDTLRESGLAEALRENTQPTPAAATTPAAPSPRAARSSRRAPASATPTPSADPTAAPPDPFSVFRAKGEHGLRANLETLDLTTLRAIVRSHRLDPARISARWTARERVIALIVDQVKARANHGRAFEHI